MCCWDVLCVWRVDVQRVCGRNVVVVHKRDIVADVHSVRSWHVFKQRWGVDVGKLLRLSGWDVIKQCRCHEQCDVQRMHCWDMVRDGGIELCQLCGWNMVWNFEHVM